MSEILDKGKWNGFSWKVTSDGELILGTKGKSEVQDLKEGGTTWYDMYYPYALVDTDKYAYPIKSIKMEGPVEFKSLDCLISNRMSDRYALQSIDLSLADTSEVEDMSGLFAYCKNLKELNVSSFDTSNVKNMDDMFFGCCKLEELDLSNFNTRKVKSMRNYFCDCNSLKKLDISGFILDNCYDTLMYDFLTACDSLEDVNLPRDYDACRFVLGYKEDLRKFANDNEFKDLKKPSSSKAVYLRGVEFVFPFETNKGDKDSFSILEYVPIGDDECHIIVPRNAIVGRDEEGFYDIKLFSDKRYPVKGYDWFKKMTGEEICDGFVKGLNGDKYNHDNEVKYREDILNNIENDEAEVSSAEEEGPEL